MFPDPLTYSCLLLYHPSVYADDRKVKSERKRDTDTRLLLSNRHKNKGKGDTRNCKKKSPGLALLEAT